jgi:hypothetical protein
MLKRLFRRSLSVAEQRLCFNGETEAEWQAGGPLSAAAVEWRLRYYGRLK